MSEWSTRLHRGRLPMWVFDQDTLEVLDVNAAAHKQYGYTRKEFLRLSVLDLRPSGEIAKFLHAVLHPGFRKGRKGELWIHRRKDGSLFSVEITSEEFILNGRPAEIVMARPLPS